MVLNMIDEACRYQVARVMKRGFVKYSELGNCSPKDLIEVLSEWLRYLPAPRLIHVDEEGVFNSDEFKDWLNLRSIPMKNCAGEAHWQNGIVERHIQTLKHMVKRMVLDDLYTDLDFEDILAIACSSKNHNGRYGGYSPMQWFHGRSHPLMHGAAVPPSLEDGSDFEKHLQRRTTAAAAFHKADARSMLRLALATRSGRVLEPQAGQIVYYFRRGKADKREAWFLSWPCSCHLR